jgi:hypothetical protein
MQLTRKSRARAAALAAHEAAHAAALRQLRAAVLLSRLTPSEVRPSRGMAGDGLDAGLLNGGSRRP